VGYILLHYLHILYEHIIYTIYMCNPQSQLSLFVRYLTTCFGPYGPFSGEKNVLTLFFVKDNHAALNTYIITYVTFYYCTIYLLIFLQYILHVRIV
jgi:hypothetical protein